METKTCTRCEKEKLLSEFQVRRASKDGYTAACKGCLSEYDKKRASNPDRVKARSDYQKTESGKIAAKKAKIRWKEKNSFKRHVHVITGNAIRDGRIKKMPCEVCGDPQVHAHHDDYMKPLDVRWLCPSHHRQWHIDNGEGINSNPDTSLLPPT